MKTFTFEATDEDAKAIEDAICVWRAIEFDDQGAVRAQHRAAADRPRYPPAADQGEALGHICRDWSDLAAWITLRGGQSAMCNLQSALHSD